MEQEQHGKPRNVTGEQAGWGVCGTERDIEQTERRIDQSIIRQTSDCSPVFDQKRSDGAQAEDRRETKAGREKTGIYETQIRLQDGQGRAAQAQKSAAESDETIRRLGAGRPAADHQD